MKRILIIDDEDWIRELLRTALARQGYEVIEAQTGAAGIELAKHAVPDLIICDVNMEELDGYGTLAFLRSDPTTASIPFILITGLAHQEGMRHGMELGADDYLPKPFTLEALYAAVATRLKKVETVRQQAEKKLADLRDNISLMLPHELRTPLNGIIAYGDILAHESHTLSAQEVSEMGNVIFASGMRLERLVENFLVYAQLELVAIDPQRVTALRRITCDRPDEVIAESAKAQAKQAGREEDLSLHLQPMRLAMSEEYVRRLVAELVQNAFKFSSKGTSVTVRLLRDDAGAKLVVEDYGRGFSRQDIERVGAYMQFERRTHEQQGLGLGLIISRRLGELHGGSLAISSEPGQRTEITVRIPLPAQSGHTDQP